jgi:hypothetical protein
LIESLSEIQQLFNYPTTVLGYCQIRRLFRYPSVVTLSVGKLLSVLQVSDTSVAETSLAYRGSGIKQLTPELTRWLTLLGSGVKQLTPELTRQLTLLGSGVKQLTPELTRRGCAANQLPLAPSGDNYAVGLYLGRSRQIAHFYEVLVIQEHFA